MPTGLAAYFFIIVPALLASSKNKRSSKNKKVEKNEYKSTTKRKNH